MSIPQSYNGKPLIHQWPYYDSNNSLIGITARYQIEGGKKDIPPFFNENLGMGIPESFGNKRPLFGLEKLATHDRNKAVFICEGEKAAAALQSMGITAITSIGGAQAANKTDWTPLSGVKSVYILPDNDNPGQTYAKDVYNALQCLESPPDVKVLPLSGLPEGGDVVDWVQSWLPEWNGYAPIEPELVRALRDDFKAELQNAVPVPDDWKITSKPPVKSVNLDYSGVPMRQHISTLPTESDEVIDRLKLSHDYPIFEDINFYGIAGDVARLASEDSEAAPVAVYYSFLTAAAAMVGRYKYLQVGESRHYARLFTAVVGASSRARKGTSFKPVERIIKQAELLDYSATLQITNGGLSSAEGLIYAVRDEAEETKGKDSIPIWDAVDDKRLLVVEEELGAVFKVAQRDGNVITQILRKAWDGGILAPMTKNNRMKATDPHINILGHITQFELKALLSANDINNGLANRFLWACVRRTKKLAFPQRMDDHAVNKIADKLYKAFKLAESSAFNEIRLDDEARKFWNVKYHEISTDRYGVLGSVTSRDEAQVLRVALLFCLLDCVTMITTDHLKAAISVIEYSVKSAEFIFTVPTEDTSDAQKLLTALATKPLTQSEVSMVFSRHKSRADLVVLLTDLQTTNKIRKQKVQGSKSVMWELIK